MASKVKTSYVCVECGFETARWLGKCPGCGHWNTLEETLRQPEPKAGLASGRPQAPLTTTLTRLSELEAEDEWRSDTGLSELNRVLGGGVVGITHSSAKAEQAYTFLQWLYSDEIAPVFTMLGGLSPCRTVYKNQDVLELYPWLSAALESFPIGQRRLHNNLYVNFSEKKLEEIISAQVKNAMFGLLSPLEALQRAQRESEKTFIPRKA